MKREEVAFGVIALGLAGSRWRRVSRNNALALALSGIGPPAIYIKADEVDFDPQPQESPYELLWNAENGLAEVVRWH